MNEGVFFGLFYILKLMNLNYTFICTKFFNKVRFFSTSKSLSIDNNNQDKNDQDKLFEEVEDLNEEWNDIDGLVEELFNDIRREETDYEVEDSDGEELGETEISKYVTRREERKNDIVGTEEARRDEALFDRKNPREDNSILLDYINKTTKDDIKTFETVEKHTSGTEDYYEKLTHTLDRLRSHEERSSELLKKFHENDLPPLLPENRPTSNESSLMDDYANPNTEMPSYIDPED